MSPPTDAPSRPARRSPLRGFIDLLWQQPLWAIPFAIFFGVLFGGTWASIVSSYKYSLVFAYCVRLAIWFVHSFVDPRRRAPFDESDRARGLRMGFLYLGAAVVGAYAAVFILGFTIAPFFIHSPQAFLISTMCTLLFVGLFGGINFAIVFYRQAVERARAVDQARAALAQAELRALRAQIHPHFLFNTLNTIASLIASDPRAAEDTVTRLAELFRYALRASERSHVSLGDELEFLRNYLAIEHTRFADRLEVREAIEPGLEDVPVPSLLLQPLVENAVRYGAAASEDGGTVTLTARREGETLVIDVDDDGPGMSGGEASGTGFGLHSVRERLRLAGPPHALAIESLPGHGTRVRVTLPLSPAPVTPASPPASAAASDCR